jgi:hypothetical protein
MSKSKDQAAVDSASGQEGSIAFFNTSNDAENLRGLGYQQKFVRNRSFYTILFQSIALVAVSSPCYGPLPELRLPLTVY